MAVSRVITCLLLVLVAVVVVVLPAGSFGYRRGWDPLIRSPVDLEEDLESDGQTTGNGTRWAVLVAGSNGYGNYRHQVTNNFSKFYFVN